MNVTFQFCHRNSDSPSHLLKLGREIYSYNDRCSALSFLPGLSWVLKIRQAIGEEPFPLPPRRLLSICRTEFRHSNIFVSFNAPNKGR